MKKLFLLSVMLLAAVLLLSGCAAPDPVEPDAAPTEEIITPSPSPAAPTPEPTITPRPMEGDIRWPETGATQIAVDPADRPTRPPIVFEPYKLHTASGLGVEFELPEYWGERVEALSSDTQWVFQEPMNNIKSGHSVPASVTISVSTAGSNQTIKDAEAALDAQLTQYRAQEPTLSTSSQDNNNIMGETGRYVTYWIDVEVEGQEEPLRMRGRWLVVPIDKRLFSISYLCPADYNSDYLNVFYKIRSTMKLL